MLHMRQTVTLVVGCIPAPATTKNMFLIGSYVSIRLVFCLKRDGTFKRMRASVLAGITTFWVSLKTESQSRHVVSEAFTKPVSTAVRPLYLQVDQPPLSANLREVRPTGKGEEVLENLTRVKLDISPFTSNIRHVTSSYINLILNIIRATQTRKR
jgi:hypothetical protein